MKPILQPAEGEILKLGPPAAGEVIVKVDSRQAQTAFAAGTETLQPGAEIPHHRSLQRDEVFFIHKGQGRIVLDGHSMTAVPGTMVFVPKQSWCSLRNTGTGLLQLTWVSTPGGIEEFFRELSRAGTSAELAAVKAIAERHGIELGEAAAAPVPGHGRRHRRRRGGTPGDHPAPAASPIQQPQSAADVRPVAQPVLPLSAPSAARQAGAQPGIGRRRHRSGRRSPRGLPAQQGQAAVRPVVPAAAPEIKPAAASGPKPPAPRGGRRGGPRRFGRVKEVYMGGKWVRVSGEGPVISGDVAPEGKKDSES